MYLVCIHIDLLCIDCQQDCAYDFGMTDKRPYKNPQFNLRIPQDLKDSIEIEAKKNGRSMNAEIVYMLEKRLEDFEVSIDEIPSPEDARKLVMKARENMGALAREFALAEIKKAINSGQTTFYLSFYEGIDLPEEYESDLISEILSPAINDLLAKGYNIKEEEPGDYTVSF